MRAALTGLLMLASGCDHIIGIENVATRAGRIQLLDVDVVTPGTAALGGLRGAAIEVLYRDLTIEDDEPILGTSPIDGCHVVRRNVDPKVSTQVDAGPVVVGGDGLRMTVGTCGYYGGYFCTSHSSPFDTTVKVTARSNAPEPTITYSFAEAGVDLAASDLVGSWLQIQGFDNAAFRVAAPIVKQDATTLTVLGTAPMGATESSSKIAFSISIGFYGPIPAAGADADFLGEGEVTIDKDADPKGSDGPPVHLAVPVPGAGFDLDDASEPQLVFPSTAVDVELSCAGAGGNCGSEGNAPFEATAVYARATRSKLDGLAAWNMPIDSEYVELECIYRGSDTARIPAPAVQAILDFAPTRVELRVARVAGAIVEDSGHSSNRTLVLVGHALIRHTDMAPK